MYAIREDPHHSQLRITLSGRVSSVEALRAIRQASTLVRTDALSNVLCDVRQVERGPGKLGIIAAFLAAEFPAGGRLAVLAAARQSRVSQRIVRFSGLAGSVRCFGDEMLAFDWLTRRPAPVTAITPEMRHIEFFAAEYARVRQRPVTQEVGPAA